MNKIFNEHQIASAINSTPQLIYLIKPAYIAALEKPKNDSLIAEIMITDVNTMYPINYINQELRRQTTTQSKLEMFIYIIQKRLPYKSFPFLDGPESFFTSNNKISLSLFSNWKFINFRCHDRSVYYTAASVWLIHHCAYNSETVVPIEISSSLKHSSITTFTHCLIIAFMVSTHSENHKSSNLITILKNWLETNGYETLIKDINGQTPRELFQYYFPQETKNKVYRMLMLYENEHSMVKSEDK